MLYAVFSCAVLVFWAIGAYNRLVRLKNHLKAGFGQLDGPLQSRHDLAVAMVSKARAALPNQHDMLDALLAATHQANTALTSLRAQAASALAAQSCSVAEQVLGDRLDQLHGALQSLKAGVDALESLGAELSAVEQRAQFVCEGFTARVQQYNAAIRQFPASLIAALFGFSMAATLDLKMSVWRQGVAPLAASRPALMDTTGAPGRPAR